MIIQRNIACQLKELLKLFPVVVILGTRQCGKTTLAQDITDQWHYFDLENMEHLLRIQRDPGFFLQQYPEKLIIDEAQNYPELFAALRCAIDADRQKKGRYILTGSSSPLLHKHLSESLAGRVATVELMPLKANEMYQVPLSPFYHIFMQKLKKENIPNMVNVPLSLAQMQEHWLRGGYPEPRLAQNNAFYFRWLQEYRDAYIYRDIKQLFPQLNITAFQRFLTLLGHLSGKIINKNDLARALEVGEKSIRDYLKIVEGAFLWRTLPSYESKIRSIVKMPKGYLRDPGLLHFLLKISDLDELYGHPIAGCSFESFVIEEIMKGIANTGVTNWEAYYYRTRAGVEVDLVLAGYFGLLPIEIKMGRVVHSRQLSHLHTFIRENHCPFGILINQSQEVTWLTETILQLPVGCL
jgi:uncharacterized protein